jgi:microcystin-dependent protein
MTADTYTARLGLIEQGTGNNNNSWGDTFNTSFAVIADRAIAGFLSHSDTGGTLDLSASPPPAGPRADVDAIQEFTGTLASNLVVQVPNLSKIWLVRNACTLGAFSLKFKTPAGSASAAIPVGWSLVWGDGANNIYIGLSTSLRDTQWLGADGTLAAPGVSFASEPGSGLRRKSAGVLSLVIGGVEIATISATGIDITSGLAVTVGGVAPVPAGTEVNTAAITAASGWYLEYGQTVTRAGDAALFAALTQSFTGNTHSNTTLDNLSADLRNLGLEGSVLEGTGMFSGATIVSVDSATSLTMSNAATNTAVGGAVRAFPFGNGDGSTTFVLPDARCTVAAGRANMGGTALTTLTTAGSNVNALKLNTVAGAQNITLDATMIPSHSHAVFLNDPGHNHTVPTAANGSTTGGSNTMTPGSSTNTSTATTGITIGPASGAGAVGNVTSTTGGGLAHANVQPTRIRNVMIKR